MEASVDVLVTQYGGFSPGVGCYSFIRYFINLIYGFLATVVVALLSIEAIAVIMLLVARIIVELERKLDELIEGKLSGFEIQ